MKATVKQTGTGLLVILFAITFIIFGNKPVNSQESQQMIAMVENLNNFNEEAAIATEPAYNLEIDEEQPLEVEDWMSDDAYWSGIDICVEAEPALMPEPWMWCDYYWSGELCESLLSARVELEPELQVEDWMSNDEFWGGMDKNKQALTKK